LRCLFPPRQNGFALGVRKQRLFEGLQRSLGITWDNFFTDRYRGRKAEKEREREGRERDRERGRKRK